MSLCWRPPAGGMCLRPRASLVQGSLRIRVTRLHDPPPPQPARPATSNPPPWRLAARPMAGPGRERQPWCHVSPSQNPGTYHHCLEAQFLTCKMETQRTRISCAFTGLSGPRTPFCECGSCGVTAQAPRSPA
ncbi:Septin-4 [Manis pentadactyla]|nr:Septin-4 [Manis pentadactyla]